MTSEGSKGWHKVRHTHLGRGEEAHGRGVMRGAIAALEADPSLLAAGGTLSQRSRLAAPRRIRLVVELALLFIAAPLGHALARARREIPIFVALLPVLVVALILLAADPTFSHSPRARARLRLGERCSTILAVFAVSAAARRPTGSQQSPELVPRVPDQPARDLPADHDPLSAVLGGGAGAGLPHASTFTASGRCSATSALARRRSFNGLLFGFAHIVIEFDVCDPEHGRGGLLLAIRYAMTRSYWAVFIEHTIWGWLVFTIGLGRFFFTGVSNLREADLFQKSAIWSGTARSKTKSWRPSASVQAARSAARASELDFDSVRRAYPSRSMSSFPTQAVAPREHVLQRDHP